MSCIRNLRGATVHFREGLDIFYVTLPSDPFKIHLTNLPADISVLHLARILRPLGFQYSGTNVLIHSQTDSSASSEVHLEDYFTAEIICQSLDKTHLGNHIISAQLLRNATVSDSASVRLQITSVACSWHKPSRLAWANYRNESEAEKAADSMDGLCLDGRNLHFRTRPPRAHGAHQRVYPVQIRNLSPETTKDRLSQACCSAFQVAFGRLSYTASADEAANRVKAVLRRAGDLTSLDVHESTNPRYMKATANFSNPPGARRAMRDLHGLTVPGLGGARLYINQRVAADFMIQPGVYQVVRTDLAALRHHIRLADHVMSRMAKLSAPSPLFRLLIHGEDSRAVVKARSAIEQILAGSIAMDGEKPLWHDFFLQSAGLMYLREIQDREGGYVQPDARKQELCVYALPDTRKEIVRCLTAKIEELRNTGSIFCHAPASVWRQLQGGLFTSSTTIKDCFTHLSRTAKRVTSALVFSHGSRTDAAPSVPRTALGAGGLSIRGGSNSCAVCWAEPDEPVETSCRHAYCSECLKNQCEQDSDSIRFPIKCLGEQGQCNHIFAIEELAHALPRTAMEKLLQHSFDTFLRKTPDMFQFCATADCPQIYRVSTESANITCPACDKAICTACGLPSHKSLSCSEHKEWSLAGIVDFQKWLKDNMYQPCPKCKTPIEKRDGCNHMTCRGCSTNFCWMCLGIFASDQIYDHMTTEHGDIGIEDENRDGWI
jgi:IBR domain, a half RING-finger domain/Zinc finger, C3HC4 type (RING finger)